MSTNQKRNYEISNDQKVHILKNDNWTMKLNMSRVISYIFTRIIIDIKPFDYLLYTLETSKNLR